LVPELVLVPVSVIGPNVLDLEAVLSFGDVVHEPRRQSRARLDVFGHPREEEVHLAAVHLMEAVAIVLGERFVILDQAVVEDLDRLVQRAPADVPHHEEHRVLHGRVRDAAEVSQPPRNQDVHERGRHTQLAADHLAVVVGNERRK
jgi:hypothetical protein